MLASGAKHLDFELPWYLGFITSHHDKLLNANHPVLRNPPQLISMFHRSNRRICRVSRVFFPLFVGLAVQLSVQAEESAIQSPNQAAAAPAPVASTVDIAKRIDPTDFKNRFDLRSEFVDYGTASMQTLVPRFEYALSKSLGFRTELPIARYDPATGGTSAGIGNLLTRVAWRALRTDDYSVVVGSELTFDTASSAALGSGKHVLGTFAFAAIDLPQAKSVFFPYIQYGKAVGGDASREDVQYTNLRASMLTRWPAKVYSFVEYAYWIDHHNADRASSQIKAELGKFILPKTGFYVRPGTGLSGTDLRYGMQWSFELGMRHFF
jgi:hypothetical protein